MDEEIETERGENNLSEITQVVSGWAEFQSSNVALEITPQAVSYRLRIRLNKNTDSELLLCPCSPAPLKPVSALVG